jgi:hypothetical protein
MAAIYEKTRVRINERFPRRVTDMIADNTPGGRRRLDQRTPLPDADPPLRNYLVSISKELVSDSEKE